MQRKLLATLILAAVATLLCGVSLPAAGMGSTAGAQGMGAQSQRGDVVGWLATGETFAPTLRATALPTPTNAAPPATLAADSTTGAFAAASARPRGDGREPARPAHFRITARSHAP